MGFVLRKRRVLKEVLLGLAVGDAVGNPLEFKAHPTPEDVCRSMAEEVIRVSDDTQMTLFLLESLKEWASFGLTIPLWETLKRGYVRWFVTQQSSFSDGQGLLSFPELFVREAPGNTCMSACLSLSRGEDVRNDSKGNGTVMRCAPIAHFCKQFGYSLSFASRIAELDARLTHKHPYAAWASVQLTSLHWYIAEGLSLRDVVGRTVQYDPTSYLNKLLALASCPKEYELLRTSAEGWVAEEALALAVGAVLHHDNYLDVITSAAAINGDSDTVASIAGGLAAASGMVVPPELIAKLNVLGPISYVLVM